ncbi:hypothetical protein KQH61_05995 [bacterium]|nr:hypothetical protein [bacterium]
MSDQVDSSVANEDKSASQAGLSQQQSSETQTGNLPAGSALAELALNDPEAAEYIRRKQQSAKDKGVDRAVKLAEQVRDDLDAFAEATGIDPAKVKEYRRNKIVDDLYEQQYGNSGVSSGGNQPQEAQSTASSDAGKPVDISAIKKAFSELDFNDEDVLLAISQNANNEDSMMAALGKIKVQRASKPSASPASAVTPSGGKPAASSDVSDTDLFSEYNRLSYDPIANKKRMDEIEVELKQRQVW